MLACGTVGGGGAAHHLAMMKVPYLRRASHALSLLAFLFVARVGHTKWLAVSR